MSSTISNNLVGKTANEKADLKGEALAVIGAKKRTTVKDLDIEILSTTKIDSGVEVLVRAWNGGGQIGFGQDGSVDIERIRIINPPVLVKDPLGDITKTFVDETGGTADRVVKQREDPEEALFQVLERTIKSLNTFGSNNIIPEKKGNTVTSAFPSSDASIYAGPGDYATVRASSTGTLRNMMFQASETGTNAVYIERAFFVFDTSAIPDTDTISATSLIIYPTASRNDNGYTANIYSSTCNDTVVAGDFDLAGTTPYLDTDITHANTTLNADKTLVFNATGIASVSKTGYTKLSARMKNYDADNTSPAGANQYTLDFSEDANDPEIVVTHAAAASGPAGVKTWNGLAQASVKTVNGLAIASAKTKNGLA